MGSNTEWMLVILALMLTWLPITLNIGLIDASFVFGLLMMIFALKMWVAKHIRKDTNA